MRYEPVVDGEGFEIKPQGRSKRAWRLLRIACCDCGLIHTLAFAIEKSGNLGIAVRREKRATAAHRRAAEFKGLRLPRAKT